MKKTNENSPKVAELQVKYCCCNLKTLVLCCSCPAYVLRAKVTSPVRKFLWSKGFYTIPAKFMGDQGDRARAKDPPEGTVARLLPMAGCTEDIRPRLGIFGKGGEVELVLHKQHLAVAGTQAAPTKILPDSPIARCQMLRWEASANFSYLSTFPTNYECFKYHLFCFDLKVVFFVTGPYGILRIWCYMRKQPFILGGPPQDSWH